MSISFFNICLLLVCVYKTADAGRRLSEGDGINFPRRTLSKSQMARCVLNKRLFAIYRIANPPLGTGNGRDLELVYRPRADGNLDEPWDARFGGECVGGEWLYKPVPGEGNRAVYTYDGPFPTTGEGITASFFSSHPRDYVFIFFCLDRTKETVRYGKRVYCDGPFRISFLTYRFPPNQVKWCAAERDLLKTFGLTFNHELTRFEPTSEHYVYWERDVSLMPSYYLFWRPGVFNLGICTKYEPCAKLHRKKSSRPEGGDNASLTALLTQVHDIRGVMASNIAKWKSTGRDTRLSDHEDHCVGTATEREANEMSSRLAGGDNENIEAQLTQINDVKGLMVSYMDKWKDIDNAETSDGHVTYYEDRADELEDARISCEKTAGRLEEARHKRRRNIIIVLIAIACIITIGIVLAIVLHK